MDRAWAELCYLHWWISERRQLEIDTTFFSEKSFAWDKMNSEFKNLRLIIAARKAGLAAEDDDFSQTMDDIVEYRTKLARLIACYLVFMNLLISALSMHRRSSASISNQRTQIIHFDMRLSTSLPSYYRSALGFTSPRSSLTPPPPLSQAARSWTKASTTFRPGYSLLSGITACPSSAFSPCATCYGLKTRCAVIPSSLHTHGYS